MIGVINVLIVDEIVVSSFVVVASDEDLVFIDFNDGCDLIELIKENLTISTSIVRVFIMFILDFFDFEIDIIEFTVALSD